MSKKRVWELDFLRGLSIILMVWDHLMFDLKSTPQWFSNYYTMIAEGKGVFLDTLYKFARLYWYSDLRANFHLVFVAIFLLVSGISFNFSHSNLKRGLKFLVVALLISAVTFTVEALAGLNIAIFFGIIHMFAVGTLLTYLVRKCWNNNIFVFILGLGIVIYGLYFDFNNVPYVTELTWSNFYLIIIGIKGYGADHFGIFPYVGVIMIGTVIGDLFYKSKESLLPQLDKSWNKPITFVGRHTLIIFVLHQIVIFALVYLLGIAMGFHF